MRPLADILEKAGIVNPMWEASGGVAELDGETLTLRFPSPLHVDLAKEELIPVLQRKLGIKRVNAVVDKSLEKELHKGEEIEVPRPRLGRLIGLRAPNPHYTFEAFVVSSSNRLAHTLARKAAEGCVVRGILYGPSGVGKTHLLHAVATERLAQGDSVVFLTGASLKEMVVDTAQEGRQIESVIGTLAQEASLLIIDDIQALEKATWKASRDALFWLLDAFYREPYKGILVASDRHPQDLNFDDRIRRRFSEDPAPIEPPDPLLKVQVFWKTAEEEIGKPDLTAEEISEINQLIAQLPPRSVGEVAALARAAILLSGGRRISLRMVESAIINAYPSFSAHSRTTKKGSSVSTIITEIARVYLVPPEDLERKSRLRGASPLKEAKMVACYILTEMGISLREVGRLLSVSPTSVRKYHEEVKKALLTDEDLRTKMERINRQLEEASLTIKHPGGEAE